MAQKPTIPKGTRDFGPTQMLRRNFIFKHIRGTFEKYGFMPLETPAMEQLSVLTGKYGDEGDNLIFKILNSGDFLSKVDQVGNAKELSPKIAEKGLRYDLTVPFARFVVMNQNDIVLPFKRYQIQPVWRADRPQKGRYREFYQCDADVVGSNALLNEAEIILMIQEVFKNLNIADYTIKINNRKVLSGFTDVMGTPDQNTDFCVAIDKLDKIGLDGVVTELKSKGFSQNAIDKAIPLLQTTGEPSEKLAKLTIKLQASEQGKKGLQEIEKVFDYLIAFDVDYNKIVFDTTLARGLSYYTGAIFEVKVNNVQIGSVCGGGRYDDLTGVFGLPNVSGVGISFGVDRIYDVMDELNLFPDEQLNSTEVLFINFDEASEKYCLSALNQVRKAGIRSELYPEAVKLKKQMNYADKKNISFVILAGSEEIKEHIYTLKNMKSGEQKSCSLEELIQIIKA